MKILYIILVFFILALPADALEVLSLENPYSGINVCAGETYDDGDVPTWNLSLLCYDLKLPPGAVGGDSVSIDGVGVVDPDFVSTGDIDFVDTSNTVTANINAGVVQDAELDYAVVTLNDFTNDASFITASTTDTLTAKTINGDDNDLLIRSHATDCTALTDGIEDELCLERDDNTIYVCEPIAGGCDTAGEWTSFGGGGADTNSVKEYYFTASALQFINAADSFPAPLKVAGTNIDINILAFDDSTDECVGANFLVPSDVQSGSTITFRLFYYPATASTNSVYWDFKHLPVTDAESWDQALTVESDGGCVGKGTTNQISVCTWTETLANTGWAGSDFVEFEICRDADNGSDNLTGDAYLTGFSVEIPRL
jgi:hypothetical protein